MPYETLELVSHHLCPYVQRSVITLTEKNIEHTRLYIDLGHKPDWFKAISPTGKVPLLRVNNAHILFESAVICEFLNEITPNSLHPDDPLIKAEHRAWIEYASQTLNTISQLYNAQTAEKYLDVTKQIQSAMLRLEAAVTLPFFAGNHFSMVDAAYGSVFRYFDTLDDYLSVDVFSGCDRVRLWRKSLAQRPSVANAVTEDYPALLTDFLLRRDSHVSALIHQAQQQKLPNRLTSR